MIEYAIVTSYYTGKRYYAHVGGDRWAEVTRLPEPGEADDLRDLVANYEAFVPQTRERIRNLIHAEGVTAVAFGTVASEETA